MYNGKITQNQKEIREFSYNSAFELFFNGEK